MAAVRQAVDVSIVPFPAPAALARLVDSLTPTSTRPLYYQPKWDGWRAQYSDGRLYSRNGTNLTPLFPDLVPVLSARLTADLHLDGEIVAWHPTEGRLDFAGLQARMTAGKRIRAVANLRPAQFVVFDVLAAGGEDLRSRPLRERRSVLERALSGLGSPIVLCQQTEDLATAREWLNTLTAGGIEGVVIKDPTGTYPARDGQRPWWKHKATTTLDMLAIGFTGTSDAPSSLVLAFPGAVDDDGQPVTAGSTTVLSKTAASPIVPLLRPTGPRLNALSPGARRHRHW
jgi:ATP-dependent DNA ligase